jgi:hypothetical protein
MNIYLYGKARCKAAGCRRYHSERVKNNGENDRWLKISYQGTEGWIFGGYTDVERGGPKYYLPETIIDWHLGWAP